MENKECFYFSNFEKFKKKINYVNLQYGISKTHYLIGQRVADDL